MNAYEMHIMKDPSLPFILHPFNRNCYINWHENIELLFFSHGAGMLTCDEERLPVRAGDIAVIAANRLHAVESTDNLLYRCLIIDRSFCVENQLDTDGFDFDLLFSDAQLSLLEQQLFDLYAAKKDAPLRTPAIRLTVLQLLLTLCQTHGHPIFEKRETDHSVLCIKQAIGYLRTHYKEEIALADVAEFVGLSKFYFVHEFKRITGTTVTTYLNIIRCEKAKALLADRRNRISDIGLACGFSSQSYFTRTFRARTGQTPGEFRAHLHG